jgi:hypothetical protein
VTVNPLVAARIDQPKSAWAGVWVAEDIELIAQGVENRSWVDGTLGVVGAGLDGLALVSDPVGALLQYGIAWLIEHVKPLSEALDWLAGDPGQIAGHAQTWKNVAADLSRESDDLARAVRLDLSEWHGAAAEAYRSWAGRRDQSLQALAQASGTMALITEGAGALIGTVRMMVRDAVATVVSRLIVYAGELIASFGLATPVVVEQVTTLCASWAAKITHWLRDLISSIRNLMHESGKLGQLIELLRNKLGSGDGRDPAHHGGEPGPGEKNFDPGQHKGPLGDDFAPGVDDPRGLFEDKEKAIGDRLAQNGEMVHPRERIDGVEGLKNPDSMVRTSSADPGTVTEFKTLESGSSGSVKENILRAGKQLDPYGGGDVVIDGRGVGLTEADAQRGFGRAAGQAKAHGSAVPARVRVILGDGRIMDLF